MSPAIASLLADVSDTALAEALRGRGWTCERKNDYDWETPSQFDERHGLCRNWLSRSIYRGVPLPPFEGHYGPNSLELKKRRLIRLRSNAALEDFVERNKQ